MTIDVRFRITRADFVLDIGLEIADGAVTAVFGPSGSGKTTLLRAIAGLEQAPDGYLRVGDQVWQNGREFRPAHRRPVGFVFQDARLFSHLTVRQNIEYGPARRPGKPRRVIDQAIEMLELSSLLERQPSQLSGGEQQRVAIARALASAPALLLLDEPLAALDERRKLEILPYLETIHREYTIPILYVSHSRNEVAQVADHLILLDRGRAIAQGNVAEIFSRLDLPLAHSANAETVIDGTVAGHDADYGLTSVDFPGGRFLAAAKSLPVGRAVRLQVLARDVSITRSRQTDTSILNIFPVTVDELVPEGPSQMTVRLMAGSVPLLSRITRRSANELGLKPGDTVFAQIKSVALLT